MSISDFAQPLVVGFDSEVVTEDLHNVSVAVEFRRNENGALCWCEPQFRIEAGNLKPACNPKGEFTGAAPGVITNAVRIRIGNTRSVIEAHDVIRVRVKGDFIRGRHHVTGKMRGVDADHLPDWLPGRITGDGIEGGTFESWFRLKG